MGLAAQHRVGLYLHIPFCRAKCRYCDFNSRPARSRQEISRYVQALRQDIRSSAAVAAGQGIVSVYFGGGTPSLLGPGQLRRILATVRRNFALRADAEITLEANPGTVRPGAWRGLRDSGINRVSLGIQSFDDALLKLLGRIHSGRQAGDALTACRRAGFENISADLIYGIPGQTVRQWMSDVQQLVALRADHISFYDLTFEPGTPLWRQRRVLRLTDNDGLARMYRSGCTLLERAGYRHYEISSFALPGKESRHNQLYWRNQTTIGCGAGAYSYVNGTRFCKCSALEQYMRQAETGIPRRYHCETLSADKKLRETLVLGLRLVRGCSLSDLAQQSGIALSSETARVLEELRQHGLLRKYPHKYALTRKGILWYDSVAASLL